MRQGISITVDAAACARLAAIVADRNRPQKHVWRARIILLTADGVVTSGSRTWSLRSPWPDPCSWSQDEALTPVSSLRCHRCRLDAPGSRRSPDPGRLRVIPSSNPIILNEASRGEQARQDQHGSHVHGPMSPRPRCFWTSAGGAYVMPFRGRSAQDLGRRQRTTLGQEGALSRPVRAPEWLKPRTSSNTLTVNRWPTWTSWPLGNK